MVAVAPPVLLDFESRSRVDLTVVGGRGYWADASSEAICCCWQDTRDGSRGAWMPGEVWPHRGRVLAAHNAAGFDRFAAERYDFEAAGWIDTSQIARRAGLPGALDALGMRWLGVPKDSAESKFTKGLSSVRKPRGMPDDTWRAMPDAERLRVGTQPTLDADGFGRVVDYCTADVAIMADAWPRLSAWLDLDDDALWVDGVVNDRGVAFDTELARALLAADERNADAAVTAAARELGWTPARVREVAGSPQQCAAALGTDNARKATLRGIDHPIVRARAALASIIRGKLLAGLERVSADGRLRDSHRYYGAHTGRWSAIGLQLHNLPRPAKRFEKWTDADICRAAEAAIRGLPTDAETIALLLRATLRAPAGHLLGVADFAGVEARKLAWLAGDVDALELYRQNAPIYELRAAQIFGVAVGDVSKVQRTVGKIAELALGYGMGARKFVETAQIQGGVDLAAIGVDPADVVAAYRAAHAPIERLWRDVERAWRAAVDGRVTRVGPLEFVPGGYDEIAAILPTGRPVVYPEPRISDEGRLCTYRGTGDDPKALRAVCPRHWRQVSDVDRKPLSGWCDACGDRVEAVWRTHVYGGKLVENIVQALCREHMARALAEAERCGLRPVMHVHDEIVLELARQVARDGYDLLRAIMIDLPEWAAGFPVGADGFIGRRYRK